MAIITISRQVAALGDEVAAVLEKELGYTFVDRKYIEQRIMELGFPGEKLKKYDERKPGFFASLAKDRDEYLDYVQTAILESAAKGNVIMIGRGAFAILEGVPNLVSVRFVASRDVRIERLKKEFNWDEKQAVQRIEESDNNRLGFHKSFFNLDSEDPMHYHLTINTGIVSIEDAAAIVADHTRRQMTPEKEALGKAKVGQLYAAQKVVNALIFEHHLNINFLRAVIEDDTLTLQGVADSAALAEKAVYLAKQLMPERNVESCISIVQDFKAYP